MGTILIAINNTDGILDMKHKTTEVTPPEMAQVITALEVMKAKFIDLIKPAMGKSYQ